MDIILLPLLKVIQTALNLYVWAIIINVALSLLTSFQVINTRNQFVQSMGYFLDRLVEPALTSIRRFLPAFGNVDLSPMALILAIYFIQGVIQEIIKKLI